MTDLHAVVDGPDAAPVLLLGPSLGTTVDLWRHQVPALAERFRVIRYDLRGHGGSAAPAGPYTLDDLGSDVLALMDRLGVARAHVAGVSLGGMVSMWLAAHAPLRVDRLVTVCSSAKMEPESMWRDRAAVVRANGLPSIADALIDRWFPPDVVAGRPDLVALANSMIARVPDEGYAGCCEALADLDLAPDLPRVGAPTLAIAGGDDLATPPMHSERIAALVLDSRLALVPGAAHLAVLSHPALVTDLMVRFLEGDGDV
jgi:3-oxoadipate enol-lactonase